MGDDKITNMILSRLERIENKLDDMQRSGCSKASEHSDIKSSINTLFTKVNQMRSEMDQNKGKLVVAIAVVAFFINALGNIVFEKIGKLL